MDKEELQYRIRYILKETGMSNTALSDLIGVSNSCIGHWLAGRYMPNEPNAERINTFYRMAKVGALNHENQAINISVDYALFRQVKRKAKETGLTPKEYVSEVLMEKLSKVNPKDAPVVKESPKRSWLDFFKKGR